MLGTGFSFVSTYASVCVSNLIFKQILIVVISEHARNKRKYLSLQSILLRMMQSIYWILLISDNCKSISKYLKLN